MVSEQPIMNKKKQHSKLLKFKSEHYEVVHLLGISDASSHWQTTKLCVLQ